MRAAGRRPCAWACAACGRASRPCAARSWPSRTGATSTRPSSGVSAGRAGRSRSRWPRTTGREPEHGLLLQIHPAFERALKGERITTDAALALLERYGGPATMQRAGIESVRAWARDNGLRAGRIIDDMFRAIGRQTVTVPGTLAAEGIIPTLARDIKAIKDRRRELGRQVEALLEDHPLLTVLTSMPGIGVRTASNILLGIGGDITNFKSAAHLAAYAGIAPATTQSGTSIRGERPARGGNKRLKNALWQAAFVASTKHPPSIAYYKRKREQGKHHNAAIICLARRRCDVIYSMLKNGTPYHDPALAA